MRNMKYFDLKTPFEIYKDAVRRKNDGDEKNELNSIETEMELCYNDYESHFCLNDLESLHRAQVGIDHQDVLIGLYSSQKKLVKDLRGRYFEINPQTYNNLCPYCVINSANTTDHILPKDLYAEYAINVKNLIPVCSECNSAKGEKVLDNYGKRFIINYYTDLIPDVQFVNVDILVRNGALIFEYFLSNPNNRIDAELYALVKRHFDALRLLKRYKEKAIQEFAEIKNSYLAEQFSSEDDYNIFAAKQIMKCDLDVHEYGRNHWKVVLLRSCAESPVFKHYILSI